MATRKSYTLTKPLLGDLLSVLEFENNEESLFEKDVVITITSQTFPKHHWEAVVTVNEYDEGNFDTRNFGKWTKAELWKLIMDYDAAQIHEACVSIGHPVDWERFDKELETYSKQDMRNLAQELKDQFGDPGQGDTE